MEPAFSRESIAATPCRVKALVTGATGFVGRALVLRLLKDGHVVHALIHDPERVGELGEAGAELFAGSVCDPNRMARAAAGCELVFHCAGESSLRADRRVYDWINVAGTENLINAARHAGCRRVVHLSCADTTLLNQDRLHWKEDRVVAGQPLGWCACSQRLAEELALAASRPSTEVTAIRSAWTWGPGDHTMLPQLCLEAEAGGVRLFGSGDNLVATLYIDNLLDALLAASTAPDAPCNAYFVTDGDHLDAGEFIGMLCRSVGLDPPRKGFFPLAYGAAWIRERLGRPGPWTADVARRARSSLFDVGRAAKDLDYQPGVSVREGMRRLAAWAERVGGPAAIAAMARSPATLASVESQVREAAERAASSDPDADT